MSDDLKILRDLSKAVQLAEAEDAKARHGSTADEYHRARLLGEAFCSGIAGTSVKAVRDLPDNAGISLVVPYHGKDRLITMTFDDLHGSVNDPEGNVELFAAWYRVLKSKESILPATATVRSTARKTVKKPSVHSSAE